MENDLGYNWTKDSVNRDTAMGYASYHENRYQGKAIYVYSWLPLGHEKHYMSGLNTSGNRNLDLIFNNSPINTFPSDQTLLIFGRYSVITEYSKKGISIIGK